MFSPGNKPLPFSSTLLYYDVRRNGAFLQCIILPCLTLSSYIPSHFYSLCLSRFPANPFLSPRFTLFPGSLFSLSYTFQHHFKSYVLTAFPHWDNIRESHTTLSLMFNNSTCLSVFCHPFNLWVAVVVLDALPAGVKMGKFVAFKKVVS